MSYDGKDVENGISPELMPETGSGAACFSPFILFCYDWWVFTFTNRFGWCCSTDKVLIPHFRKYISARHLDIGVGTGFYYSHVGDLSGKKISLMDLNYNCLKSAEKRVKNNGAQHVEIIQHDVFKPFPFSSEKKFSSVSSYYLFK
ncbi:methyltransferase [Erwinia mallotivora]|uniref:methyltransferase n=1 Tax=Erwinia mallotivora TaxID=69222 RepID=UPI0035E59F9D